jgi:hypothetical protein
MKVGDLVRWTAPGFHCADVGLITKVEPGSPDFIRGMATHPTRVDSTHIFIQWMVEPEDSAYFPADHKYLELVNESR